jgi:MOSC domain-containing protein YiiM
VDASPPVGRLTAVCVVHALRPDPAGDTDVTAIDKRAVNGPVEVGPLGLAGDTQCDAANHGGVHQAVYAYADEDAQWWADRLDRPVPPGLFGENLRTNGLDVTGAEIGERWRVGDPATGVLVEVTAFRTPCVTFQHRMAEPHWVRRFTQGGRPGAYLRVVVPGRLEAGDPVAVERRPGHGVSIGDIFPQPHARAAQALLDAEGAGVVDLHPSLRAAARRALRV